MNRHSVTHTTFAIERTYPVPPARVFAAFADPVLKARWFGPSDWVELGAAGTGTRMTFTEQHAFLDGLEDPTERERGTRLLLDALGTALEHGLGEA